MDFDDLDQSEVIRRCEEGLPFGTEFLEACPCIYRVTRPTVVSYTAADGRCDIFVDELPTGGLVRVLAMEAREEERCVRGRVEKPSGWIKLVDTDSGQRFADRLEDDSPGVYLLTKNAKVTSTLTRAVVEGCKDLSDLCKGTLVWVLEVECLSEERRIRGRIEHPVAGWISILNTENGYRWAEKQQGDVEVPLLSLESVTVGAELRLLRDAAVLAEACAESSELGSEQCALVAGTTVEVLALNVEDSMVKVSLLLFGDVWLDMSCFAFDPDGAAAPASSAADAAVEHPVSVAGAFSRLAREQLQLEEEADPAQEAQKADEVEEAACQGEAVAGAYRVAEEVPAVFAPVPRSPAEVVVDSLSGPGKAAGEAMGDAAAFPVGVRVRLLDYMALRSAEKSSSKEVLRLERGCACTVVAHSTTVERRLLVRDAVSSCEGWISSATKGGRPLIELAPALPAAPPEPADSAALPSVQEVLDQVERDALEQDALGSHRADVEAADPELEREEAEEAIAIWRCFADLDQAVDERAEEENTLCVEAREYERKRFGPWTAPSTGQVILAEDRRLRFMEAELTRRDARERHLKEKLQKAMTRRRPIPKSRAIVHRMDLAATQFGGSGSGQHHQLSLQHVSLEDLRQRLAEERQQQEDAGGCQSSELEATAQDGWREHIPKEEHHPADWLEAGASHAEEETAYLHPGNAVYVHRLRSSTELNGVLGTCERWDSKTERWVVRLENGQCKKLREQNLLPTGSEVDAEGGHGMDDTGVGEPEEPIREFGPAPFAFSMRNGIMVSRPAESPPEAQGSEAAPWYAPWMVPGT